MTATILFQIIISILIIQFLKDFLINLFNAKHFKDEVPAELADVYEPEKYIESQAYKLANYRFSLLSSLLSLLVTLVFFGFGGVALVQNYIETFVKNDTLQGLTFLGVVGLASTILQIPFSWYQNFVIEAKFGFNKSTPKLFIIDTLKSLLLTSIIGGLLYALIHWVYMAMGANFWWITWVIVATFVVLMNMFYSSVIVPLFNKQTLLEEGSLKDKILTYTAAQGFNLDKIFVIDGSKRSTKANAYFAGFGPKKRIVLYDTLINDLTEEEIVAVFAHEVGHYKRKHIISNLIISLLLMGFTLYLLGLMLQSSLLSEAFGLSGVYFHIGLVTFGILYAPISEITSLMMNIVSRKFEYQADDFAKNTYNAEKLISALKKLSQKSLSNLTPHYLNVFFNYSHPTLYQRIQNLKKV